MNKELSCTHIILHKDMSHLMIEISSLGERRVRSSLSMLGKGY